MKRGELWSENPGTDVKLMCFQNEALTLPSSVPAFVARWTRKMLIQSKSTRKMFTFTGNSVSYLMGISNISFLEGVYLSVYALHNHKEQICIFACSQSLHTVPFLALDSECTPACTLR